MSDGIDLSIIRAHYPALQWVAPGTQKPDVFLDGPGGTQVPQVVIDAYAESLLKANANRHAPFFGGDLVEKWIEEATEAVKEYVGAQSPREIIFGANMTSLAFHLADSLAGFLKPGDEVIVTGLDHDANIAPWVHAAKRSGATVRVWPMRLPQCTLEIEDLLPLLNARTKWVAFTGASNAVGTLTPVAEIIRCVRQHSQAMTFVDAVHLSPHALPDARGWDADFVALSPYKFFGPHSGVLCGREATLDRLTPPKVRPSPTYLPDSWMTGTQNHEAIHGVRAAIHHLADLETGVAKKPLTGDLRSRLTRTFAWIREHETGLSQRFLQTIDKFDSVKVHGSHQPGYGRVSTFGLELRGKAPFEVARELGRRGFRTYAGNFYALSVTQALGLEGKGGLLRIGFVHYNTLEEAESVAEEIGAIMRQ